MKATRVRLPIDITFSPYEIADNLIRHIGREVLPAPDAFIVQDPHPKEAYPPEGNLAYIDYKDREYSLYSHIVDLGKPSEEILEYFELKRLLLKFCKHIKE